MFRKIISILLVVILLLLTTITPINLVYAEDNSNNSVDPLSIKESIADNLEEEYGSDWYELYNEIVNASNQVGLPDLGLINPGSSATIQWGNSSNSNISTGNYTSGTHDYIINAANNDSEEENRIPNKYLELVCQISKRCDTEFGMSQDDDHKCYSFHGGGNYIAAIAYLWRYAKLIIANHNSVTSHTPSEIKAFLGNMANQAYNDFPKDDWQQNTIDHINRLRLRSSRMLKNYYSVTTICYESGQTWAGRCRYIIYGMALHCLGDVFAHRVLFFNTAADALVAGSNTGFNLNHYLDYEYFNSRAFNLSDLINAVQGGSICTLQLKDYISSSASDINALIHESHSKYADNPSFYPSRINESIVAASFFIDTFKDVSSVSHIISYADTSISPIYGFSLHGYTTYCNQLNV